MFGLRSRFTAADQPIGSTFGSSVTSPRRSKIGGNVMRYRFSTVISLIVTASARDPEFRSTNAPDVGISKATLGSVPSGVRSHRSYAAAHRHMSPPRIIAVRTQTDNQLVGTPPTTNVTPTPTNHPAAIRGPAIRSTV